MQWTYNISPNIFLAIIILVSTTIYILISINDYQYSCRECRDEIVVCSHAVRLFRIFVAKGKWPPLLSTEFATFPSRLVLFECYIHIDGEEQQYSCGSWQQQQQRRQRRLPLPFLTLCCLHNLGLGLDLGSALEVFLLSINRWKMITNQKFFPVFLFKRLSVARVCVSFQR